MAIKILTDSTSDLPKEITNKYELTVLPLRVIFGDKEYVDGVDLTLEQFYTMIKEADDLPTTSQVTPEQFMSHFEDAKAKGDDLICIHIGSALSGTLQSATIAKEQVDYAGIHLVDTRTLNMQLALIVAAACEMREKGASVDEILTRVFELVDNTVLYASVATLKYLKKGGRIKPTSAAIGSALKIKPIITIADGLVESIGKARGIKKSYEEIKKFIDESGSTLDGKDVFIAHADDEEGLVKFKAFLLENYKPSKIYESVVGSVVGTHAGPGCVTVAFEQ